MSMEREIEDLDAWLEQEAGLSVLNHVAGSLPLGGTASGFDMPVAINFHTEPDNFELAGVSGQASETWSGSFLTTPFAGVGCFPDANTPFAGNSPTAAMQHDGASPTPFRQPPPPAGCAAWLAGSSSPGSGNSSAGGPPPAPMMFDFVGGGAAADATMTASNVQPNVQRPQRATRGSASGAAAAVAAAEARPFGRIDGVAANMMPAFPAAPPADVATSGAAAAAQRPSFGRRGGGRGGRKQSASNAAADADDDLAQEAAAQAAALGVTPQRMKRILANRRSAAAAKARKAEYYKDLEREVVELRARVGQQSPNAGSSEHVGEHSGSSGRLPAAAAAAAAPAAPEFAQLRSQVNQLTADLAAARDAVELAESRAAQSDERHQQMAGALAQMQQQLEAQAAENRQLVAGLQHQQQLWQRVVAATGSSALPPPREPMASRSVSRGPEDMPAGPTAAAAASGGGSNPAASGLLSAGVGIGGWLQQQQSAAAQAPLSLLIAQQHAQTLTGSHTNCDGAGGSAHTAGRNAATPPPSGFAAKAGPASPATGKADGGGGHLPSGSGPMRNDSAMLTIRTDFGSGESAVAPAAAATDSTPMPPSPQPQASPQPGCIVNLAAAAAAAVAAVDMETDSLLPPPAPLLSGLPPGTSVAPRLDSHWPAPPESLSQLLQRQESQQGGVRRNVLSHVPSNRWLSSIFSGRSFSLPTPGSDAGLDSLMDAVNEAVASFPQPPEMPNLWDTGLSDTALAELAGGWPAAAERPDAAVAAAGAGDEPMQRRESMPASFTMAPPVAAATHYSLGDPSNWQEAAAGVGSGSHQSQVLPSMQTENCDALKSRSGEALGPGRFASLPVGNPDNATNLAAGGGDAPRHLGSVPKLPSMRISSFGAAYTAGELQQQLLQHKAQQQQQ